MSKKRILLHAFETLDGDFVRRLLGGEPDMEVVGEVGADGDLVAAVARSHADVVIASTPATGLTDSCRRLLAESTKLRVFAFAPPEPGSVFELQSRERELSGEVTPSTLVRTIRGAA